MANQQGGKQPQPAPGVSTVAYDVMALLYNKLEAIAAIEDYRMDAEEEGDQEFSALLDELEQQDSRDVERLRKLLVQRLGSA